MTNKKLLYTKEEIKELATVHLLEVVFTKVDGTERKMACTLMPNRLPPPNTSGLVAEQSNRKENDNVVVVWDLNSKGWRSFRVESVKSILKIGKMEWTAETDEWKYFGVEPV